MIAQRRSRFLGAGLPALQQTLHSPLFYHEEPACQQKFPVICPTRPVRTLRQMLLNVHDLAGA
jgi:hypothetical protein